jgi:hypothetical protein
MDSPVQPDALFAGFVGSTIRCHSQGKGLKAVATNMLVEGYFVDVIASVSQPSNPLTTIQL